MKMDEYTIYTSDSRTANIKEKTSSSEVSSKRICHKTDVRKFHYLALFSLLILMSAGILLFFGFNNLFRNDLGLVPLFIDGSPEYTIFFGVFLLIVGLCLIRLSIKLYTNLCKNKGQGFLNIPSWYS